MRNQEIFEKLTRGRITEEFSHLATQDAITDADDLRSRIDCMLGIPGFKEYDDFFQGSIIYRTRQQKIQIPRAEYNELKGEFGQYLPKLRGLHHFLQEALTLQDPEAIFVKLPPSADFREAIRFQEQFAKALEQVVFTEGVNGSLKVKSWERGSLWIELALGGSVAVSLVGSIAWSATVLYKKLQEAKLHVEYARGLGLRNDSLEDVLAKQKELLALLVDTEARNIASAQLKGEVSHETIERIKFTIKEFSELIEKGAEIHPALQAPEQVSGLFPNFRNILGIESKTQMLK